MTTSTTTITGQKFPIYIEMNILLETGFQWGWNESAVYASVTWTLLDGKKNIAIRGWSHSFQKSLYSGIWITIREDEDKKLLCFMNYNIKKTIPYSNLINTTFQWLNGFSVHAQWYLVELHNSISGSSPHRSQNISVPYSTNAEHNCQLFAFPLVAIVRGMNSRFLLCLHSLIHFKPNVSLMIFCA